MKASYIHYQHGQFSREGKHRWNGFYWQEVEKFIEDEKLVMPKPLAPPNPIHAGYVGFEGTVLAWTPKAVFFEVIFEKDGYPVFVKEWFPISQISKAHSQPLPEHCPVVRELYLSEWIINQKGGFWNGSLRKLTEEGEELKCRFNYDYDDGNCSCHLGGAPCSSCTHPGNPHNLDNDDEMWEPL